MLSALLLFVELCAMHCIGLHRQRKLLARTHSLRHQKQFERFKFGYLFQVTGTFKSVSLLCHGGSR